MDRRRDPIYDLTLGPEPPISLAAFLRDVFTTEMGWTMMGVGIGVGFLFAVFVLAISVVSVPLLLDRDVGLAAAIGTSLRAVMNQPRPDGGLGPDRRERRWCSARCRCFSG